MDILFLLNISKNGYIFTEKPEKIPKIIYRLENLILEICVGAFDLTIKNQLNN